MDNFFPPPLKREEEQPFNAVTPLIPEQQPTEQAPPDISRFLPPPQGRPPHSEVPIDIPTPVAEHNKLPEVEKWYTDTEKEEPTERPIPRPTAEPTKRINEYFPEVPDELPLGSKPEDFNVEASDLVDLFRVNDIFNADEIATFEAALNDPSMPEHAEIQQFLRNSDIIRGIQQEKLNYSGHTLGLLLNDLQQSDPNFSITPEQSEEALRISLKPGGTMDDIFDALQSVPSQREAAFPDKVEGVYEVDQGVHSLPDGSFTKTVSFEKDGAFVRDLDGLFGQDSQLKGVAEEAERDIKTSQVDLDFILGEEGGYYLDGYIPSRSSGVTVGSGVDLGMALEDDTRFRGLQGHEVMDKIRPYLAVGRGQPRRSSQAQEVVDELGMPQITPQEAYALSLNTKAGFVRGVRNQNREHFDNLNPAVRTALVDTAYHAGGIGGIPLREGASEEEIVRGILNHRRFADGNFATRRNNLKRYLQNAGVNIPEGI